MTAQQDSASSCFVLGPPGHPSGRTPHDEAESYCLKQITELFDEFETKCEKSVKRKSGLDILK